MAKLSYLFDTWDNIKEVDLRPLRQQALNGIRLALVGAPGSGRAALADQMRRDPRRSAQETDTPVLILDLEAARQAVSADLVIIMVDAAKTDVSYEKQLSGIFSNGGKKVLIFVNQIGEPGDVAVFNPVAEWGKRKVVWGSALDTRFLIEKFAPAVIDLLLGQQLALARFFPLFRVPVAHYLINDACITNAAYSLSTGLAASIPLLNIPVIVADTIILTKNQAFLAYKLGLAFGFSTRWQDYLVEFGGVLGNGLFWRQVAHMLVSLIPVAGIVPKTGIAYAGTYVVGNAILQWYLTGRHLSGKQMKQLYSQAFGRGQQIARNMRSKMPRLRRGRRAALPASPAGQTCPACGRLSAADASFCQYCGQPFAPALADGQVNSGKSD